MYTQSVKEAKETIVFVLNFNGEIEETTLYDHVTESAEETTSPRGVMTKLFVDNYVEYFDRGLEEESKEVWALKQWGFSGKSPAKIIATFDTEEEANDEWYTRVYNFDFQNDDQRDTSFFLTRAEAEQHLAALYPNMEHE
jgi:hypothetical protein